MGSIVDAAGSLSNGRLLREPLQFSGALSGKYQSIVLTPSIGQEFPNASIKYILTASNSDELLRDLAITGMFQSRSHP